ncbi:MAG: bifunctional phosphoglucose/phosphomannose isomerase [Cytophagales bacterium]|nr:bifunctional phosphoglucose/phosphomannose isomerase [Bernardetiaceae bacterium]MDW8210480.1 bifunctional phosphoglucose/phosphomannose isomerase [Cytophagales bacterium]
MSQIIRTLIESYPLQVQNAIELGRSQRIKILSEEIRHIAIAGLGGSGIGGSLVKMLTAQSLSLPLEVLKSYDVPAWIDSHTLLIASSHSGNTEETLTVAQIAAQRGAKIIAITTGGKLEAMAKTNGWGLVLMPFEHPCPRQYLAYSLVQQLWVLVHARLISSSFVDDLAEGANFVKTVFAEGALPQQAEKMAQECKDRLVFIYADERLAALAVRFQQQLNENAKQIAHVNVFPEMNHNELVGWRLPEEILSRSVVFLLRSQYNHPRVETRLELCHSIFQQRAAKVLNIFLQGSSLLAQTLYFIHLTDWISYFLAQINGVDAYEIDVIHQLKNQLAKQEA